jgi:hypothetical protein
MLIAMKFILAISFIMVLLHLSCSDSPQADRSQSQSEIDSNKLVKHKPPASFSDTLVINFPAAVFFYPDSLQLEKIKVVFTKMEFESTTHECEYQMKNTRMSLRDYWPQIRIIEATKARYLLFIKSDGSKIHIDLNTINEICGLFLFNRKKNPKPADMTNIGTELDFYFLK